MVKQESVDLMEALGEYLLGCLGCVLGGVGGRGSDSSSYHGFQVRLLLDFVPVVCN